MDLKETFDRALDGGPIHRPIEDRLTVGRRATRRRRTAMGAGALATTLVVGGLGWAVAPGDGAQDSTVATQGTAAATPDAKNAPERRSSLEICRCLATYSSSTGELLIRDGWTVTNQVPQPIRVGTPVNGGTHRVTRSVGLDLTDGTERVWTLVWWSSDHGRLASANSDFPAEETSVSFGVWLDQRVAQETDVSTW